MTAALSSAPAGAAVSSDDCLACHGDPELKRADGRRLTVDRPAFDASTHAALACTDCHADLAGSELPHPERLAPADCSACHPDAVESWGRSAHAAALRNGSTHAARCADCHSAHAIRSSKDADSPTHPLRLPETCGRCHGNPEVIAEAGIAAGDVFSRYKDSIHGRVLERSGLVVAPSCGTCHGSHDVRRKADPESGVHRQRVPGTCGKCHAGIEREFSAGVHGTLLAAGDARVPNCATCHTAHAIRRVDAEPWKLDVLSECGACHAESMRTYRDTFHGQVTSLGFTRVAACADCHDAHRVLPLSDPASPISPARRVSTCRKCHPGANENFAAYDPHADKHDPERSPFLHYSARFMQLLLGGVFAFFGVHTGLWFTRLLRPDPPPKPPARDDEP